MALRDNSYGLVKAEMYRQQQAKSNPASVPVPRPLPGTPEANKAGCVCASTEVEHRKTCPVKYWSAP